MGRVRVKCAVWVNGSLIEVEKEIDSNEATTAQMMAQQKIEAFAQQAGFGQHHSGLKGKKRRATADARNFVKLQRFGVDHPELCPKKKKAHA